MVARNLWKLAVTNQTKLQFTKISHTRNWSFYHVHWVTTETSNEAKILIKPNDLWSLAAKSLTHWKCLPLIIEHCLFRALLFSSHWKCVKGWDCYCLTRANCRRAEKYEGALHSRQMDIDSFHWKFVMLQQPRNVQSFLDNHFRPWSRHLCWEARVHRSILVINTSSHLGKPLEQSSVKTESKVERRVTKVKWSVACWNSNHLPKKKK